MQRSKASPNPSKAHLNISWHRLVKALDHLLARGAAALLKGPGLQDVCSGIPSLVDMTASLNEATDASVIVLAAGKLAQLLAKLLAASKRARDLKHPEYSSRVCSVLAASRDALHLIFHLQTRASDTLQLSDVLSRVVAAQQQLTQLLANQLVQLAHSHTQQQQQQQQAEKSLAMNLLCWWVTALHLRQVRTAAFSSNALYEPAVELAAVLAQTLTADSPTSHLQAVVSVPYKLCVWMAADFGNQHVSSPAPRPSRLFHSPAFLQLTLGMLVLSSYSAQQQMPTASATNTTITQSSNSSSSLSHQPGSPGSGVNADTAGRSCDVHPPHAAPSTPPIALHASAGPPPAGRPDQQQLADITMQLWQAAGFNTSALPGLSGVAETAAQAIVTNRDSACYVRYTQDGFSPLPANSPAAANLKPFLVMAQAVQLCFEASLGTVSEKPIKDFDTFLAGAVATDKLARKQQQLLQALSRPLPLFLLQTALQCGGGCPAVTQAAARAAWCCLPCWVLPGLRLTPASTTGAAAASSAQLRAGVLLGPVLDCWQLLMKQQLLEQPAALLPMAAASAQQLPGDSMQAQQLFNSSPCSCAPYALQTGSSAAAGLTDFARGHSLCCGSQLSSRAITSITADCAILLTVSDLIALLQPLKGRLLMLLEILARRVLSCNITCSSSSSSNQHVSDGPNNVTSRNHSCRTGSCSSNDTTTVMYSMGSLQLIYTFEQAINCLFGTTWPCAPIRLPPALLQSARAMPSPWQQLLATSIGGRPNPELFLQQLQDLHQQFCSLAVSYLKLPARTSVYQLRDSKAFSLAGSELLIAARKAAEAQAYCLAPHTSLADARELLTPWMVLLGRHLRAIGSALQCLRTHTAEALGIMVAATVPLSSRCDSSAGSTPGIVRAPRLLLLVHSLSEDAVKVGSCLQQFSQVLYGFSQSAATCSADGSSSSNRWATINSSSSGSSRSATGINSSSSTAVGSGSGISTSLQAAYAGSSSSTSPDVIVKDISTSLVDQTQSPTGLKAAAGSLHSKSTTSESEPAQPLGGMACHLVSDSLHCKLGQVLQAAGAAAVSAAKLSAFAGHVAKLVHRLKLQASHSEHGAEQAAADQCSYSSCSCKECERDNLMNTALLELPDTLCIECCGSLKSSDGGCHQAGSSGCGGSSNSSSSSGTASVQGGRPLGIESLSCRDTEPLVARHDQSSTASSAGLPPTHTGFRTDWTACGAATTPAECLRSFLAADIWQQVCQQLQEVGTALCNALPVPWLCNNPGCTNMAGASELQLIGGRSCVCGGCRVAR